MTNLDTSLGWRAKIFRNFALKLFVDFGFVHGTRNPAAFALDLGGIHFDFDGRGHSPGDFELQIGNLEMFFASPVPRGISFNLPISLNLAAVERYSREFGLNLPITMPSTAREHYIRDFALNLPVSLDLPAIGRSIENPRFLSAGWEGSAKILGTELIAEWQDNIPLTASAAAVDFWWAMNSDVGEQIPEFDVLIGEVPCQILANLVFMKDATERDYAGAWNRVTSGWVDHYVPLWADIVDVVLLGAGAGGNAGGFGVGGGGNAGGPGQWATIRLVRGVDFPIDATPRIYAPMGVGSAGAVGANAVAGWGSSVTATLDDVPFLFANGGQPGIVGFGGWGNPGSINFNGRVYSSGGAPSTTPGCGGTAGGSTIVGGNPGAAGGGTGMWIYEKENSRLHRRRLIKATLIEPPTGLQDIKIQAKTNQSVRQQVQGRASYFDNTKDFGPVEVNSSTTQKVISEVFRGRPLSNDLGPNWIHKDQFPPLQAERNWPIGIGSASVSDIIGSPGTSAKPIQGSGNIGGGTVIWHEPMTKPDIQVEWRIGDKYNIANGSGFKLILGANINSGHCVTYAMDFGTGGMMTIYLRSSVNTTWQGLNQQTQRASQLTAPVSFSVCKVTRINKVYRFYLNNTELPNLAWNDAAGAHPISQAYNYVGFNLYIADITTPPCIEEFRAMDLV